MGNNLYIALIVLFSLILGSFLNVCIYRLPRGESIVFPPSHCPNCKNRIKPYDLIPVLSYVILKGRCRYCKQKISVQYPTVELLVGICGGLSYLRFGLDIRTLLMLFIACVLIYISAVDIKTMEISSKSIFALLIAKITYVFLNDGVNTSVIAKILLGGFLSAILIFLIYVITKGNGMGFGDVLLIFAGGVGFSAQEAILANFLAFVIGAIFSLIILAKHGAKDNLKKQISFGPFICAALYITILYGNFILEYYIKHILNY